MPTPGPREGGARQAPSPHLATLLEKAKHGARGV